MQSMANSAEARGTERRRIPRQKSFLRGMIYFNNRRSVADCLIRDISPYGARLIFSDAVTTPDLLDLYIPQKEQTLRSQVIWRVGQRGRRRIPAGHSPAAALHSRERPGRSRRPRRQARGRGDGTQARAEE